MENRRTLANGISLYDYRADNTHSFFISVFVRAGSMYESYDEWGISHFLEHAAIRNVNYLMGGKLYSTLDRYGIDFNATTYTEMIRFYVSGAKGNLPRAADILAKLFEPISLPASEISAERQRIKAEIREDDDRGSLTAFTNGKVFDSTSLSRFITGSCSSVSRIGAKRLEEYRRRVFTKDNLFVYLCGSYTDSDLEYLAKTLGACRVFDGEPHDNIAPVPTSFGKREGAVYIKNAPFTKVCLTFDIDMTFASHTECDLLYGLLLSGYDSELFIELSEKRGLLYDVGGNLDSYRNIGSLCLSFELREQKLYEALSTVVELLCKYKSRIPEDRFLTAPYVDNAEMLLDDPRELNFTFGYENGILGRGYGSLEDRKRAYASVTRERLCEVASGVFSLNNLTLTLKGNKKRIDINKIKEIISALG